jgi:predicted RNA-binding Zn-ribbon protein involved in translation (DUF1610 family)
MTRPAIHPNSANRCQGCGYVLDGISAERCPECGRVYVRIETLAEYRESRAGLRRTFLLSTSRVIVRGRQFWGDDFELPVELATLEPEPMFARTRVKWFTHSVGVLVFGSIFAGVAWLAPVVEAPASVRWGSIAAAFAGLIMLATSWRKVEYAYFISAGRAVLDIGRRGPDVDGFDEFVIAVRSQIRAARADTVKPA